MSTLQKNIFTLQDKLSKLKPGSRNYNLYIERLAKKVSQFIRFKETRTRAESLQITEALKNGKVIDFSGFKFSKVI